MTYQKLEKNKGFSMIELIISISVLSIGIIGTYNIFSDISALAYNISPRFTATYLAKEGMEIIKNIRDNNFVQGENWMAGLAGCDIGCQADYKTGTLTEGPNNGLVQYQDDKFLMVNSDGFYSYDEGSLTIFKRKITINSISNDILKIDVEVTWDYNKKPFSFKTEGYLYNWY